MKSSSRPPLVWLDQEGSGRNVHAYFRREFFLKSVPSQAELHLFANSRYHLYVNGTFIEYGPVRHYPDRPLYDTHHLSAYLKPGANVIAAHVASWGMETYHHVPAPGVFVAWGEIGEGSDAVQLSTASGWKCRRANGYDANARKFSFAQAPIHLHDARLDTPNWNQPQCAADGWLEPVALKNQDAFGTLAPRSIPHLTQTPLIPRKLLGAYELEDDEIYAFHLAAPDLTSAQFGASRTVFAYTYIHSPRAQEVVVAGYWGDHALHGENLKRAAHKERPTREEMTLKLNEGWNFYCDRYGMIWGSWDYYLVVPPSAGLKISATRDPNGTAAFMAAGPFTKEEEEQLKTIPYPFKKPDDLPQLSKGWEPKERSTVHTSPGHGMTAMRFVKTLDSQPTHVADLKVAANTRTAFVFDLGRGTLGRIFVEYDAPAGTVLDVGFSEDLKDDQPTMLRRCVTNTGEREIARGGPGRLETFEPRGFRYLQVSVLNHTAPVTIKHVGAVEQIYPFEQLGRFECSDNLLNDVWKLGWNALRLCSEDIYTDCPLRERTLYAGDMLAETGSTIVCNGDLRLARRCVEIFAQHQSELNPSVGGRGPCPRPGKAEKPNAVSDFAMATLLTWAWYLERTGDLAFARQLYPVYRRLMENALENRLPDGTVKHGFAFIEWVEFDRGDRNACVHAQLSRSFAAMSSIAAKIGEKGDIKRYADAGAELANTTRQHFWDANARAYRDGYKDGKPLEHYTPCSSAWAVLYDVASPTQEEAIRTHLENILSKSQANGDRRLSPYGAFYVLGALYKLGQVKLAEELMRREWGRMCLEGYDTVWETFESSASLCHAWAGAPTFYLSTKVLGVPCGWPELEPTAELVIAPQSESLDWAKGSVPHPKGLVQVDWRIDGEHLRVVIDAPSEVKWKVAPVGRLAGKKLWVNGRAVEPQTTR